MAALRGGSYDKAIASFREVVTNYPAGDLASNAQFWIGESYYTKGDLESAVTAYRKVLVRLAALAQGARRHGEARLLAVGSRRNGEARNMLEDVVRKYPGTTRGTARDGSSQAPSGDDREPMRASRVA